MPYAVTHKDTQPIASHQAGKDWIGYNVLDSPMRDE